MTRKIYGSSYNSSFLLFSVQHFKVWLKLRIQSSSDKPALYLINLRLSSTKKIELKILECKIQAGNGHSYSWGNFLKFCVCYEFCGKEEMLFSAVCFEKMPTSTQGLKVVTRLLNYKKFCQKSHNC